MTSKQAATVDVAERAVKTFVESFLVAWAASNYAINKVAIFSAGVAALSIVWNVSAKVTNPTVTTTQV